MKTNLKRLSLALVMVVGAACGMGKSAIDVVSTDVAPEIDAVPADAPVDPNSPPGPSSCDVGTSYEGFGGMVLEVGRDVEDQGFDRDRVKPYSSLSGEYARVLGKSPALLSTLGATFGA